MGFDIKEKIDEIVEKIKSDKSLLEKFEKNPVSAVESLIGIDLPDDKIEPLINGIKAKLAASVIGDKLGGLFGK